MVDHVNGWKIIYIHHNNYWQQYIGDKSKSKHNYFIEDTLYILYTTYCPICNTWQKNSQGHPQGQQVVPWGPDCKIWQKFAKPGGNEVALKAPLGAPWGEN